MSAKKAECPKCKASQEANVLFSQLVKADGEAIEAAPLKPGTRYLENRVMDVAETFAMRISHDLSARTLVILAREIVSHIHGQFIEHPETNGQLALCEVVEEALLKMFTSGGKCQLPWNVPINRLKDMMKEVAK
jgi:hypothetical protein